MVKMKVALSLMILLPLISGFSWFSEEQGSNESQPAENKETQVSRVDRKTPDLGRQADVRSSNAPSANPTGAGVKSAASVEETLTGATGKAAASPIRELKQLNRTLKTIESVSEAEAIKNDVAPTQLPGTSGREGIEISRLQKQINEILQVNEKLKNHHEEQLSHIRKITEQAAMHRRMLDDLDKKELRLDQVSVADMDEVLRQEKLRLIQQETEKNEDYVNQMTTRQSPNARVS